MFTSKVASATELLDLAFDFVLGLQTWNVFSRILILTAYNICIARKGFLKVIVGDIGNCKVSEATQ